jgi:hypothetical protein
VAECALTGSDLLSRTSWLSWEVWGPTRRGWRLGTSGSTSLIDKLRIAVVVLILALFTISVFTSFPQDPGTRTILGTLALAAAGFLFGPTLLKRKGDRDA